jgi:hypothetical protein
MEILEVPDLRGYAIDSSPQNLPAIGTFRRELVRLHPGRLEKRPFVRHLHKSWLLNYVDDGFISLHFVPFTIHQTQILSGQQCFALLAFKIERAIVKPSVEHVVSSMLGQ